MRFITLGLAVLLAGCAASSSGYYTQSVNSWRGGNVKDLIKSWGKPYTSTINASGTSVYVYRRQSFNSSTTTYSPSIGLTGRNNNIPVITSMPNANTPASRALSTYCLATFTANAQGKIIDTNIQGNNCYFNASDANALANTKNHPAN